MLGGCWNNPGIWASPKCRAGPKYGFSRDVGTGSGTGVPGRINVADQHSADSSAPPRSVSKSAVSRQFVTLTTEHLQALMSRRLDDVRLAVLMLDGIDLKGRTNVVALGITTDGVKIL